MPDVRNDVHQVEPYPYISKTPEDVWRLIFIALYEDVLLNTDRTPGRDGEIAWVTNTLGYVCRYWRDIARHTPILFSYISLVLEGWELEESLCYLQTCIELSGSLPFTVSLLVDPLEEYTSVPFVRAFTAELLPHLRRLRSFSVRAIPEAACDCCAAIFKQGRNPLSLLPRDEPLTGFPLSQLTVLRLENVRFAELDHLLIFLINSPKLEVLTIRSPPGMSMSVLYDMRMPAEPETRIVHLPSLRKLTAEVAILRCLYACVLRTPQLKDVALDDAHCSFFPLEGLPGIRFMQPLKSLQVVGHVAFDSESMILLIWWLHELRRLSIQHCPGVDDRFLKALCLVSDAEPHQDDPNPEETSYLAANLDRLELIGTSITNKGALRLLNIRSTRPTKTCSADNKPLPPSKTVMLHISGCWATNRKLGREIRKRRRGTWSEAPRTQDPHCECQDFESFLDAAMDDDDW